jgi:cyclophilin family peptidyl-prolyl cis-trans isomerase
MVMFAGCGGGGGAGGASPSTDLPPPPPIVTDVRTESLKYGLPSMFIVTGSNLNASVTSQFGGATCLSPTTTVISSTEMRLGCTPDDLGPLQISLVHQGVVLRTHPDKVVKPRVLMSIGTGGTEAQLEVTVEPGTRGTTQRAWANNFLSYVNQGYYNDTIFHGLYPSAVVDGGCYSRALKQKPAAAVFALDPLALQGNAAPPANLQYTLSMNPDACVGSQFSGFSLYVVAGNNRDTSKYIIVGSFSDQNAAAVDTVSNLVQRGGDWLAKSPSNADLAKGTIKNMSQTH